jgi:hypothetical protein
MTIEMLNLVLTLCGIVCTMVIALLGAIWAELRSMRKEFMNLKESHGNRLLVIENVLLWLPCKRGQECGEIK